MCKTKILILLTGMIFLGIGYKFQLIQKFGSDVPFMDPWGAEAEVTLLPFLEKKLDYLTAFWTPHCEHHVGLTRMWSLTLTLLNGQWDNKVICTINAIMASASISMFLIIYRTYLKGLSLLVISLSLCLLMTNPLSWENTLGCFQIQFTLAFMGTVFYLFFGTRTNSYRDHVICIFISIFLVNTMASSIFAPASIIIIHLILMFKNRDIKRRINIIIFHTPVLIFFILSLNHVPGHEKLKAKDISSVIEAFINISSTPIFPSLKSNIINYIFFILINFPFSFLLIQFLRNKIKTSKLAIFTIAFSIYVYISILATSYSRNLYFDSSRYFDTFYLIILLNALSLAVIINSNYKIRGLNIFSICWTSIIIISHIYILINFNISSLIPKWESHKKNLYLLANGIITKSEFDDIPISNLPYINHETLKNVVTNTKFNNFLPPSIRKEKLISNISPSNDENCSLYKKIIQSGFHRNFNIIKSNSLSIVGTTQNTHSKSSYLRVMYTGSDDLDGSIIKLFSKGKTVQTLPAKKLVPFQWKEAHFKLPRESKSIEIGLTERLTKDSWIAFTNPVEITFMSWLLRQVRKNSYNIMIFISLPLLSYILITQLQINTKSK